MDKRDARALLSGYLSGKLKPESQEGLADLINAHRILKYPMPQSLGTEFAAIWQKDLPAGYTAIVWAEGSQMRYAAVKSGHENRFQQMIDNPNDIDDID